MKNWNQLTEQERKDILIKYPSTDTYCQTGEPMYFDDNLNLISLKYQTFEMYLIEIGSRLNEFTYSIEDIYNNLETAKKAYLENLSAYKFLLFLSETLTQK